jgi:hypothetical protein
MKSVNYDTELIGGLDHISQTKNQVVFHDIGMNSRARDITILRSRGRK